MIIGNIKHMLNRIGKTYEIQTKTTGAYDPLGGDISSWNKEFDVLGAIQNISGNEVIKADKLGVDATHILYVDGAPDITEGKRLYDSVNNKYYRITYVDDPMNVGDFLQVYMWYSVDYVADSGE